MKFLVEDLEIMSSDSIKTLYAGPSVPSPTIPLSKAKEMTEWQQNMSSVHERDDFLLNNELFTDCTFTVGEDLKQIMCHRVYLAKTSATFAAMLYGRLYKKNEVIHLPDVTPDAFKAMLEYIYSGKIKCSDYSYRTLCHLLYMVKKYLLPKPLHNQLRMYLCDTVAPDNVWTAIEFARCNDEPKIYEKAWMVVENETEKFLHLDSFIDVSMTTLLSLVQRSTLSCQEIHLFQACMTWANNEIERSECPHTEIRDILAPVLPHIRFLAIPGEDFVKEVKDSGILTPEEVLPILTNALVPQCDPVPNSICKISFQRNSKTSFYVHGVSNIKEDVHKLSDIQNDFDNVAYATSTALAGEQLIGIEIPTQEKNETKFGKTYEEDITVIAYKTYSNEIVRKVRFKKVVFYNTVVLITFDEPYLSVEWLLALTVKIIFHKSGVYPFKAKSSLRKIHLKSCLRYDSTYVRFINSVVWKKSPLHKLI